MFKSQHKLKKRSAKQCRERWHNHLDPSIKKAPITIEEEVRIFGLYKQYGNKWARIAKELENRYVLFM